MAAVCGRGKTSFTRRVSFRDASASPARSFCSRKGQKSSRTFMGLIRFVLTRDGSRRLLVTLSRRYGANSRKGRPNHSMHPTAAKSAAAGDARSLGAQRRERADNSTGEGSHVFRAREPFGSRPVLKSATLPQRRPLATLNTPRDAGKRDCGRVRWCYMLRYLAIAIISVYQRYISPYKGFRCAYRYATGRSSCSEYARRITLRIGVVALWKALPKQFARCRLAYERLMSTASGDSEKSRRKREKRRWWENCDCHPCDLIPHRCDGPADFDLPCDCSP